MGGRKNKKNKSNNKSSSKKEQQQIGVGNQQQPQTKQEDKKIQTIQQKNQQKIEQVTSNNNEVDQSEYVCKTPQKKDAQQNQEKQKQENSASNKLQEQTEVQKAQTKNTVIQNEPQSYSQVKASNQSVLQQDLLIENDSNQPQTVICQQNNLKDNTTPQGEQLEKQLSEKIKQQQVSTLNPVEVDDHDNDNEQTTQTKVQSVPQQVKMESSSISGIVDQSQQQQNVNQQNLMSQQKKKVQQEQSDNQNYQKQIVKVQNQKNNQSDRENQTGQENQTLTQQNRQTAQNPASSVNTQEDNIEKTYKKQQLDKKEKGLDQSQYLQRKLQQSLIDSLVQQVNNSQKQIQKHIYFDENKNQQIPEFLTDSKAQMANSLKQKMSQKQSQEANNLEPQHQNISFKKPQEGKNIEISKEIIEQNTSNQIQDQGQKQDKRQILDQEQCKIQSVKSDSLKIQQIEERQIIQYQDNQIKYDEKLVNQDPIQQNVCQIDDPKQQSKTQQQQKQLNSQNQSLPSKEDKNQIQVQQDLGLSKESQQVQNKSSNQVLVHKEQQLLNSQIQNKQSLNQKQQQNEQRQEDINIQVQNSVNTIIQDVQTSLKEAIQQQDKQQINNQKSSSQLIDTQNVDKQDQILALGSQEINESEPIDLECQQSKVIEDLNIKNLNENEHIQSLENNEESDLNNQQAKHEQITKNEKIVDSVQDQNIEDQANENQGLHPTNTIENTQITGFAQKKQHIYNDDQDGQLQQHEEPAKVTIEDNKQQSQPTDKVLSQYLNHHLQSEIRVEVPDDNEDQGQNQAQVQISIQAGSPNRPVSQTNQYQSDDSQLLPFSAPTKQKVPLQQQLQSQFPSERLDNDSNEKKAQNKSSIEQMSFSVNVNTVQTPPDSQSDQKSDQKAQTLVDNPIQITQRHSSSNVKNDDNEPIYPDSPNLPLNISDKQISENAIQVQETKQAQKINQPIRRQVEATQPVEDIQTEQTVQIKEHQAITPNHQQVQISGKLLQQQQQGQKLHQQELQNKTQTEDKNNTQSQSQIKDDQQPLEQDDHYHNLQNKTSMDEELRKNQNNQIIQQQSPKQPVRVHRNINIDIDQIETNININSYNNNNINNNNSSNNNNQTGTNKTIDSPINKVQSDKLIQATLQYEKQRQQQLIRERQTLRQMEIRQQQEIRQRQQRQREQLFFRQQQQKRQLEQKQQQFIRAQHQQAKQAEQRRLINQAEQRRLINQSSIQRRSQQTINSSNANTSGTSSSGLKIHTVKVSSRQPQFLGKSGLNINQNLIIRGGDTQNQQFPSFSRKEYPTVYEKQGQPITKNIEPTLASPQEVQAIQQRQQTPIHISQSRNVYAPVNTISQPSKIQSNSESQKRKQFFQSHSRPAQEILVDSQHSNNQQVEKTTIMTDTRSVQRQYSEKPMQFQESQISIRQQSQASIKQQSEQPISEIHFFSKDSSKNVPLHDKNLKPLGQNQPNMEDVFSQTMIPLQPRRFATHMEAQSHHKQQQQDLHDPTNTPLQSQSPTFNYQYHQRLQQHHAPSVSQVAEQLKKIAVHPIHHLHHKPNYEGSNVAVCQTQIERFSSPSLKGNSSDRIETHSVVNNSSLPNDQSNIYHQQPQPIQQPKSKQDPIVIARKHSHKFKQFVGDDSAQKKLEDMQKSINSESNWKKNSPNIVFNQIGRQVKSFSPPPEKMHPHTVSPSQNQKYNYQYPISVNRMQSQSFYQRQGIKDHNQAQSTFRKEIRESVELKSSVIQNSNRDKKIVIPLNSINYSSPQGLKKDILETSNHNNTVNYSPLNTINTHGYQNQHNIKVKIGNASFHQNDKGTQFIPYVNNNKSTQLYPKKAESHGFGQTNYQNSWKQKIENFTEIDRIKSQGVHTPDQVVKKQKIHILLKHSTNANVNNVFHQPSSNRVMPHKIDTYTPDSIKNNTAPFYNPNNDINPKQNLHNSREKPYKYSIDYYTHRPIVRQHNKTEHQEPDSHHIKLYSNSKWTVPLNYKYSKQKEFINSNANHGKPSQSRDKIGDNLNFSRSTHAAGKLNSYALERHHQNKNNHQSRDRKIYTYSHEKKQSNAIKNNLTKEKASLSKNKQVLMHHHSHSKGKKQKIVITLNRDHLKPRPKYQIFNANRTLRHNQNVHEKKVQGIVKDFERSPYNQHEKSKRSQHQIIGLEDSRLRKKAQDKQYIQKKFQHISSKGASKPLPKFNQAHNKQMRVQQSSKQTHQFKQQEKPLWERVKNVIQRGNPLLEKRNIDEGLSDVEVQDVDITSKR